MDSISQDESEIRTVLESWAAATRQGRKDDVLANHVPNLIIFDVLKPMKYDSAEAYRRSWDDWQPQTEGEAKFDLEELVVVPGKDIAVAYGFIRCGGQMPDGRTFEDVVRVTFCLTKQTEGWKVFHQHVSKPLG